jgi:hypothetical protein
VVESSPRAALPLPELGNSARALRVGHIGIAVVGLGSLVYIWLCALTGRRDQLLGAALATRSAQAVVLVIGRGDCPLGPLQERLGDPDPLFELVLPRRAAKAAIPVLVIVALGGVAIVAFRSRSKDRRLLYRVRTLAGRTR